MNISSCLSYILHSLSKYLITSNNFVSIFIGVSILFKKPMKKPPNLFSFMSPLSLDVWIYMATAYLGVSVLLFILARYELSFITYAITEWFFTDFGWLKIIRSDILDLAHTSGIIRILVQRSLKF